MLHRVKGALFSYKLCRAFSLNRLAAFYRAARYFLTGRCGRFCINLTPPAERAER